MKVQYIGHKMFLTLLKPFGYTGKKVKGVTEAFTFQKGKVYDVTDEEGEILLNANVKILKDIPASLVNSPVIEKKGDKYIKRLHFIKVEDEPKKEIKKSDDVDHEMKEDIQEEKKSFFKGRGRPKKAEVDDDNNNG